MKYLTSAVFGRLTLDEELPEHPSYTGTVQLNGCDVQVTLAMWPGVEMSWDMLLKNAEKTYSFFSKQEQNFKNEAAHDILKIHREYFKSEWSGSAQALVKTLKLRSLNLFSNGSLELWYEGKQAFHHLDVNLIYDSELRLKEARFDG